MAHRDLKAAPDASLLSAWDLDQQKDRFTGRGLYNILFPAAVFERKRKDWMGYTYWDKLEVVVAEYKPSSALREATRSTHVLGFGGASRSKSELTTFGPAIYAFDRGLKEYYDLTKSGPSSSIAVLC